MFSPPPSERGFILVGAIWLLILCGAIAAVLMLRGISAAKAASHEDGALAAQLALEGAIETALAGILIDGGRSPFAFMPARVDVEVGGRKVTLLLTGEAGRIDLNEADPQLVALALQGMGIQAAARALVVERLRERRGNDRPLSSLAELRALLAPTGSTMCIEDEFTIFSAMTRPAPGQMSPRLSAAFGEAVRPRPVPIAAGYALRLDAQTPGAAPLRVVARATGLLEEAVAVHLWERGGACPSPPVSLSSVLTSSRQR